MKFINPRWLVFITLIVIITIVNTFSEEVYKVISKESYRYDNEEMIKHEPLDIYKHGITIKNRKDKWYLGEDAVLICLRDDKDVAVLFHDVKVCTRLFTIYKETGIVHIFESDGRGHYFWVDNGKLTD